MEYCGGGELSDSLKKKKKFNEAQAKIIVRRLAQAISYLHRNGTWQKRKKQLVQPGIEPGTSRVLGERDNHYTTEPLTVSMSALRWLIAGPCRLCCFSLAKLVYVFLRKRKVDNPFVSASPVILCLCGRIPFTSTCTALARLHYRAALDQDWITWVLDPM